MVGGSIDPDKREAGISGLTAKTNMEALRHGGQLDVLCHLADEVAINCFLDLLMRGVTPQFKS